MSSDPRLTDDELREVLSRAEEIERGDRKGAAVDAEFNAVVEAGVSVGLARVAMEQALRERGVVPMAPPSPGEMAFALSADGNYYAATEASSGAGLDSKALENLPVDASIVYESDMKWERKVQFKRQYFAFSTRRSLSGGLASNDPKAAADYFWSH